MTTPIKDVVGIQTRTSIYNSALINRLGALKGMSTSGVCRYILEDWLDKHYEEQRSTLEAKVAANKELLAKLNAKWCINFREQDDL